MLTLSDLFAYAKQSAFISSRDYINPTYTTYEQLKSDRYWYNHDRNQRDHQRRRVMQRFGAFADSELPIGKSGNGRLTVTQDSIDYKVGQYEPLEIWDAVYDFLQINFS